MAASDAHRARARRRWSLLTVPLAAGACVHQLQQSLFVLRSASTRNGSVLVDQPRWLPSKARGPAPLKYDVHGSSADQAKENLKWALKFEAPFVGGQKLWAKLKAKDEVPKKIYIVATTGRQGPGIGEALAECLAYIQPEDGTLIHQRQPNVDYPKSVFDFQVSDKEVAQMSRISAVDLYMEDEDKYRDLETEVIRKFAEKEMNGYPAVIVLGDSALENPQNVEIIKQGLVIWVDTSLEDCWQETQRSGRALSGLVEGQEPTRPPVWAIANGWDGDADDFEGKAEYMEIAGGLRRKYEEYADIRLNADNAEVRANPVWGAGRLVKAMAQHFGFSDKEGEAENYEEEVLEQDLAKFFESARLAKYLPSAKEWCTEQGAASIEEVLENVEELGEALKLKPLEKKRFLKAAESVQEALAV